MAHLHCEQVVLLKDKKKVFTLEKLDYEPETGAIHPGGTTAAVGGAVSVDFGGGEVGPCNNHNANTNPCVSTCSAQDGKVRLYSVQGNSLKEEGRTLEATGRVTAMAFSHDGAHLAVTDEKKVLRIFTVADDYAVS